MSRQRPKLASSHQRSWLWGRHVVLETLRMARWPIVELLMDEHLEPALTAQIQRLAVSQQIAVQYVAGDRIQQLTGANDHQGLAAQMGEFPYEQPLDLQSLVQQRMTVQPGMAQTQGMAGLQSASLTPLFVICDRIQDAHNFGAIVRCCDGAAVDGILVSDSQQAAVTPHVARSSAGAVNSARIFRFSELIDGVRLLKAAGVKVVAASEKSASLTWDVSLQGAVALIVGSEAFGVHPDLLAECDQCVRIAMLGQIESLNAAVAAGILLYEIRRPLA